VRHHLEGRLPLSRFLAGTASSSESARRPVAEGRRSMDPASAKLMGTQHGRRRRRGAQRFGARARGLEMWIKGLRFFDNVYWHQWLVGGNGLSIDVKATN